MEKEEEKEEEEQDKEDDELSMKGQAITTKPSRFINQSHLIF